MPVDKSASRIRQMFGEIAERYDLLNRLLSAGVDQYWRRRTVRLVPPSGDGPILDVCTGTGDLALAYWRAGRKRIAVVGVDFTRPMLTVGQQKLHQAGASKLVRLVEGDAQQVPFADDTFEIVCVAFGLRNVSDTDQGLKEMVRVCRPGGRVAVLEFAMPRMWPLRSLYAWYFRHVLPRIGQTLTRNRQAAYNYLPTSVGEFPQNEALVERMQSAGLDQVRYYRFTLGIAVLYVGVK
jgi:demethylmenaquinone methyltransferase/2-methoxy-6-polyprenyl-1,4-benzoquinol methylase